MVPGREWLRGVVLGGLILFGAAEVSAQSFSFEGRVAEDCALPDLQANERPAPDGPPTQITIGFRLIDVTEIDDISQSITADFILLQSWTDPRLADYQGCSFGLDEIWTPNIDVVNSGRLFKRLPERVDVQEAGLVRYVQRFRGPWSFPTRPIAFPSINTTS